MTAESIINPSTVVANGIAVTTAAPLPVTLVGGVVPTAIAIGTPITGGATNQVLYQDSSSNLAEITKANSSVLISNGSGVPSWSTTLPAGLAATSMALTTPTLGVAAGTSLALGGATIGANALAVTGTINASSTVTGSAIVFGTNGSITPASNGVFTFLDTAGTGFTKFQLGGTTSSFPAIARSGNTVQIGLADASNWARVQTGQIEIYADGGYTAGGSTVEYLGIGTSLVGLRVGSGTPTISAGRGTIYLRTDGLPYYNTNGTTGWDQLVGLASANTFTAANTFTTIATAAPAGSSAGTWKLGALQTGAVVLDTTRSIYVDIGGTVYHLMVST